EKSALWHISGGEVKDIRSSTDGLRSVSIDRSGERIVSSSVYADFKLDLFSGEGLKNRQELGRASNVTFTPDGRLLFSANTTGKHNIWIMNADGTGRTQLTNDPGT